MTAAAAAATIRSPPARKTTTWKSSEEPAGVNPEDYINSVAGDDPDDVDDFQLVRNIQKQFSIADDDQPLSALPPDEEEDDFETLRRIQQRFGAYGSGTLSNKHDQSCDFDGPLEMDSNSTERSTSSKRSSMLTFEKGSMPKAALSFIDAIKKNRSQQKFICNKMIHLETRIEENKRL